LQQYHIYTARDFALDENFQQWVLKPDVKNNYEWSSWLKQHPEKEKVIAEAVTLVKSIHFRDYHLSTEHKDQLWDAIWDNIATDDTAASSAPQLAVKRRLNTWKYAAALLLGVLLGTLWLTQREAQFHAQTLSTSTLAGQTKRLMLPDSSEVVLNAGSRLVYAQKAKDVREVWLDGEAWFHVHHNKQNAKFIVHTFDRLSVEVLGTTFNVSNFGNKIAVALQEGSVKLNITEPQNPNQTQLYLQPGEILSYDKQDGEYTKCKTDVAKITAWTHGQLMMDEYTVADAIQFMQQVFDKQVAVKDTKMLLYRVSGSMPIVYNADTMLIQFEKAFGVHFYKKN
jgi:ferric-dicitrate binding protein FerR (iron transport regulator)